MAFDSGSDSQLRPIQAWVVWCFEESMNLITILGDLMQNLHLRYEKHEKNKNVGPNYLKQTNFNSGQTQTSKS